MYKALHSEMFGMRPTEKPREEEESASSTKAQWKPNGAYCARHSRTSPRKRRRKQVRLGYS